MTGKLGYKSEPFLLLLVLSWRSLLVLAALVRWRWLEWVFLPQWLTHQFFTGLAIAGSSVLVAATENINKDYIKAKNNKTANELAKEVGAEDAESLKEEYVGRGNGTLFNMFKNKKTGQIVLKGIRIAAEIATDYYLNTKK